VLLEHDVEGHLVPRGRDVLDREPARRPVVRGRARPGVRTGPVRTGGPGIPGIAAVASAGVAEIEVRRPGVGGQEVESLVGRVVLRAAEARDRLVDVPDQQAGTGDAAVVAGPGAVLDEEVLVRVVRALRPDLDDATALLDRRERHG